MIGVKRAYEPLGSRRGKRYLFKRLWPRGIRKNQLRIDAWLKTRCAQRRIAIVVLA